MTQLEAAREGQITAAMKTVAAEEHISEETVRERVAEGTVVIPANIGHRTHQDEREPRDLEGRMQL